MSNFLSKLNQRPIAFYPVYKEITGSVHGAILLSQLMYWFSKKSKIYKTNSDFQDELGFTERELKTAKNHLKKAVFITVKKEGLPAKTYYSINWDEYEKTLRSLCEYSKDETVQTRIDGIGQTRSNDNVLTGGDDSVPTISETTAQTTAEKKELKEIEELLNFWKSFDNLINHRTVPKGSEKALAVLRKNFELNEVFAAIKVYSLALASDKSWLDYKWTLNEFLSRENACMKIMESAPNFDWLVSHQKSNEPKKQSSSDYIKELKKNATKTYTAETVGDDDIAAADDIIKNFMESVL